MRKTNFLAALLGVLLIISGISSLLSPVGASSVIPYIAGLVLIVIGAGKILIWMDERRFYSESRWNIAGAVASLLFGIVLVISPSLQISIGAAAVMLLGGCIMVFGTLRIVHAFRLRKMDRSADTFGQMIRADWHIDLMSGTVMVIIGLMNILNPAIGLGLIGILIGFLLIFCGSSLLSFGSTSWYW